MFVRYAVYVTLQGPLAEKGAAWLGWDVATGQAAPQPALVGVDVAMVTAKPRKYGLHGTIKPPFHLVAGAELADLQLAMTALCQRLVPVEMEGLVLHRMGGFLALTPTGDQTALAAMAGEVVKSLDRFRAPPSAAELARRRQNPLNPEQERHLADWGYPYVMDQFRFHITLTGCLDDVEAAEVAKAVVPYFEPDLPEPFRVDSLTLVGQTAVGMFQEIHRYALTG